VCCHLIQRYLCIIVIIVVVVVVIIIITHTHTHKHTHTHRHMYYITPVGKPMPALVPAVGDLLASR
jgi:uncharacterized membrane protein